MGYKLEVAEFVMGSESNMFMSEGLIVVHTMNNVYQLYTVRS